MAHGSESSFPRQTFFTTFPSVLKNILPERLFFIHLWDLAQDEMTNHGKMIGFPGPHSALASDTLVVV